MQVSAAVKEIPSRVWGGKAEVEVESQKISFRSTTDLPKEPEVDPDLPDYLKPMTPERIAEVEAHYRKEQIAKKPLPFRSTL